jgi:hypothetical protein
MLRLTSIIALLMTALISTAQAQWQRDWIPIGQRYVGFNADRDVISVVQSDDFYRERPLRAFVFLVDRNDIEINEIRLTYQNGFTEDFRIGQIIRGGGQFELDLRGERSYIKEIEMRYRSNPDSRRQAIVSVYGIPARRFDRDRPGPGFAGPGGPRPPEWVELGCQSVNLTRDRDEIRVGRRDGRFRAIRLAVRDADIEIQILRVVYLNGRPDDLPVQSMIRAGDRSRPLDLQGTDRGIDRIEMVYRTVINPAQIISRGQLRTATVCAEGLQNL